MGKIMAFAAAMILFIAFVYGWVLNIVALIKMGGVESLGLMVLRIIGIFVAPLGSVLGWLI
jgi:hypothetical protein